MASHNDIANSLVKSRFPQLMMKIIKDHTKFPLRAVRIYKNPNPLMMCGMKSVDAFWKSLPNRKKTAGMGMVELRKLYDDRLGKMEEQVDPKLSPFGFSLIVNTGLWACRIKDGSFLFTAEELAATTLHEMGHIDQWIRVGERARESLLDASDIIDYVKAHPDRETALGLLEAIKKTPVLDKSWTPVVKATEAYFQTSNDPNDPSYAEALSALSLIVTATYANQMLSTLQKGFPVQHSRLNSNLFTVDTERSADEFSTRHGAGAPLISFLKKLDELAGPGFTGFYEQVTGQEASFLLKTLMLFKTTLGISAEEIGGGYDPTIRRMGLIIETAKHAFQDDMLPPEMSEDLRADITEAESYLEAYRTSDYRQVRVQLKAWKDRVAKFGRILVSPFHNRLSADYGRLGDANRSLSRHPLYYLAKS